MQISACNNKIPLLNNASVSWVQIIDCIPRWRTCLHFFPLSKMKPKYTKYGYCSQPPGGKPDVLASLFGLYHVVHLYIQSMVQIRKSWENKSGWVLHQPGPRREWTEPFFNFQTQNNKRLGHFRLRPPFFFFILLILILVCMCAV